MNSLRRRIRAAGISATAVVASVGVLSGTAAPAQAAPAVSAATAADVRSDADWILSAQMPDGAIANYPDKKAVWPYLSHFAAAGLARAYEVTANRAYSEAAWRWLEWYQAHEGPQGFVTDYVMSGGALVSTGDMDSTDSYGGMMLVAARAVYRATADRARLARLKPGILGAVAAVEATQDADGLTWAKPAWHVKYLMDQAEAYAGLLAAVDLGKALGDPALADRAQRDADRMRAGVETLWNAGSGAYDWAKHDGGARVQTNWSYLYSDSLQQVWAVAFGLVPPARVGPVMARFAAAQPTWALPASTAAFSGGATQTVGYWPVAAMAFAAASTPATASAALVSIRSASVAAGRAWPFTVAVAGQLVSLETYTPATSFFARLPQGLLSPTAK